MIGGLQPLTMLDIRLGLELRQSGRLLDVALDGGFRDRLTWAVRGLHESKATADADEMQASTERARD